jgi:hypothetical protein
MYGLIHFAFSIDKCPQCKEEQILIKGELVLHVLYFCKYLEGHETQPDQIFPHFSLFNIVRKVVVFLEDESGMGISKYKLFETGVEAFLNWLFLWKFEELGDYLLMF